MMLSTNSNIEKKLEKPIDIKIIKNKIPMKKPIINIPIKEINNNYIHIQLLKMERKLKCIKKTNIIPNNAILFERNKELFKKNLSDYNIGNDEINFAKQRVLNEISYKDDKIDKMTDCNDISLNELKIDLDFLSSNTSYIGDDEKILFDKNIKSNNSNVRKNNLSQQGKINNTNSQISVPNVMNLQLLNNFCLNQQNINNINNFRNNYSNNNAIYMNNIYNSKNYLQTISLLNNMNSFENYNRPNYLNQLNKVNNNFNNLPSLNFISYINPVNYLNMINNKNINIINQIVKNQNILSFLNKINQQNKLKEFNIIQKFKENTPNGVKIHTIKCTTSLVKK